jgi:hypothetical protein
LSANDVIAELTKQYPSFIAEQWEPHKPLAIGIREAVQDDGIRFSERELCYILKQYTTRIRLFSMSRTGQGSRNF